MKTTRYQFERDIEGGISNAEWLKGAFNEILQSDKHFTAKADYIGYGINSLDQKIDGVDEQIKELQSLKKRLKEAREIALSIGAEVFSSYGIDKLEGAGISSITLTEVKVKTDTELIITDEAALIALGYFTIVIDTAKVIEDFTKADERERLSAYCDVILTTTTTQPKLKINKRRSSNNCDSQTELLIGEVA